MTARKTQSTFNIQDETIRDGICRWNCWNFLGNKRSFPNFWSFSSSHKTDFCFQTFHFLSPPKSKSATLQELTTSRYASINYSLFTAKSWFTTTLCWRDLACSCSRCSFFAFLPPKMVDGKTRKGKNYNFNKWNEVFVVLIMTVILTVVSLQPAT